MPTPPTGDIACAASPMHSSPGRDQRFSRSIATVSSFTSSQLLTSACPAQDRRHAGPCRRETRRARAPSPPRVSLGDHIGALPIVAAVESHHQLAGLDAARTRSLSSPTYRRETTARRSARRFLDLEPELLAHDRMPAIAADREVGADLQRTLRRVALTPMTASPDQIRSVASAIIMTFSRKPLALLPQEIQKIPLRHEGDEGELTSAAGRGRRCELKCRRTGRPSSAIAGAGVSKSRRSGRLIHHLQRRGMHGIAAKIAEEIGVLFQHDRVDAGAASRYPSIMPAGPPPTMQQRVVIVRRAGLFWEIAGVRSSGSRLLAISAGMFLISDTLPSVAPRVMPQVAKPRGRLFCKQNICGAAASLR